MALLSLFLLPTNVRAGSEIRHSHSILQLLLDAQDGQIAHHHPLGVTFGLMGDWFDPGVSTAAETSGAAAASENTDLGDHQDSIPVIGGLHLMVSLGIALWLARPARCPIAAAGPRLRGAVARVPAPPPRLALT